MSSSYGTEKKEKYLEQQDQNADYIAAQGSNTTQVNSQLTQQPPTLLLGACEQPGLMQQPWAP